jgi:hypothetical protein
VNGLSATHGFGFVDLEQERARDQMGALGKGCGKENQIQERASALAE